LLNCIKLVFENADTLIVDSPSYPVEKRLLFLYRIIKLS